MKKKIIAGVVVFVFIVGIIYYFRPISISKLVNENQRMNITYSNLGVRNGQAFIDSEDFNEITDKQKDKIINLLAQYSYRRNWNTFFTNGSMNDVGEHLMHIYVYDNDNFVKIISVSSTNKSAIGDKNYSIKNAEKLITEMLDVLK